MENYIDDIPEEEEPEIEFVTNTAIEYINAAWYALDAAESANMMTKDGQLRMNRIKRKCLGIIDHCISELYDEIFEEDNEQT